MGDTEEWDVEEEGRLKRSSRKRAGEDFIKEVGRGRSHQRRGQDEEAIK